MKHIAIIGAGPAGLMAAEAAIEAGAQVSIYDAMPSVARKFLMAGKSGLNISHSEEAALFRSRYRAPDLRLDEMIAAFGPGDVERWMRGLGIESFTGSSGRVFPVMMKASPLLRAWLARLREGGARLHVRHRWQGWDEAGALVFHAPEGEVRLESDVVILALGGASWSRLGSDGAWAELLAAKGVELAPFQPSNCGFEVAWSKRLLDGFEGAPLKGVKLSTVQQSAQGDVVITRRGVESGALYPLSADLLRQIEETGSALLKVDLRPDVDMDALRRRLAAANPKESASNRLRKAARLDRTKIALVNEITRAAPADAGDLAAFLKALPVRIDAPAPMDEAISTAGGVSWDALDERLMLKALPGVYCAGEMVDWDAPTGGYLLTACLAMGRAAGEAAAAS